MNILSNTIGMFVPKYRTIQQWSVIYKLLIEDKPICDKTKANRLTSLQYITTRFGDSIISNIRPHEISKAILELYKEKPQKAKRVLIEIKDCFAEALIYGWINRNPAIGVKIPPVRVVRKRLTLEQWWGMLKDSMIETPPWVSRMLALALITGQRRSDLVKMRFSDIWDDALHIKQHKTGTLIALPLDLTLDAISVSLRDLIEDCKSYTTKGETLLRKHNGESLGDASLSARFEITREKALGSIQHPPSLHECRSLSERLYRVQGINTMMLLGHKHQTMTDLYNDDRGLSDGVWKVLSI